MPRRIAAVLAAGLALVALAGCGGGDQAPQASPGQVRAVAPGVVVVPEAERGPLPGFAGPTTDGGRLDLATLRGKPLVLNFWASWCGPCRREQKGLELASRRLAERGVRVVGVNIRDDRGKAAAYLEEFGVSYPSLADKPAKLAALLGRYAPDFPPYTLVVDAEGRIAARIFGVLPSSRPESQADFLVDVVERAT